MEQIRKEETHKTYEQYIENAYVRLVFARTTLKTELKRHNGRANRNHKQEFYSAFIELYGLTYPKLKIKEHKDMINKINAWDKNVKLKQINDSIEEGIPLSEELQKALMFDGVIGD